MCIKNIINSVRNTIYIVKAVWTVLMLWLVGLFSMFIVGVIRPDQESTFVQITFVPLLVGIVEIILFMTCCCNKDCREAFLQSMYCFNPSDI